MSVFGIVAMLWMCAFFFFFFFNDTATTEIYTLSLHDALPICRALGNAGGVAARLAPELRLSQRAYSHPRAYGTVSPGDRRSDRHRREGDVQFHRRAEQGVPHSAPRGYGFGRTRGGRAQLALRRGAAPVLHRSHVPSRKAAEGAVPAVSPGWSRGARVSGP